MEALEIVQLVHRPQRRGAEIFASQLSRELRARGHGVRTIYLYAGRPEERLVPESEDRVLDGSEGHLLDRLLGVEPGLVTRLRREIEALAPQIVQTHGGSTLKYAAFARGRRDVSWHLVYRNVGDPSVWLAHPLRRWFYRLRVAPAIEAAVAVGESMVEPIRRAYGDQMPIRVIPTAVDPRDLVPHRGRTEVRDELATPADAIVAVFVGRFSPEKRVDRLLRAVAAVRPSAPRLHLWLVGAGPEEPAIRRRVAELGLQPVVRFTGVSDRVPDLLGAADLLALTSDTEGVPGVVLEAGGLGLPVVATRVGGVPDCVLDGETGLLVEPDDEPALARALSTLAHDPVLRAQLGAEARRRVAERFSIGAAASAYEALYRELIAGGGARGELR